MRNHDEEPPPREPEGPPVPPSNLDAEKGVLGALLLSNNYVEQTQNVVAISDFYKPSHGLIFAAIVVTWDEGTASSSSQAADPTTVAECLKRTGNLERCGGVKYLLHLVANAPATSSAPRYGKIVAELAGLRKLVGIASEMRDMAWKVPEEGPGAVVDWARSELNSVDLVDVAPQNLHQFDAFLDRPQDERPPWVIPGQLRVGWRVMIVAPEGVGKTVLMRQMALLAAQGRHPFIPTREIPPVRTLAVDLENPDEAVTHVGEMIRKPLRALTGDSYDPDRCWLWHEPSGVNLRTRTDRNRLEAVIREVRPQLVVMGPVYKTYEVGSSERGHEQGVREVQTFLDQIRARYKFALVLEHHAPLPSGGKREMRPSDSSLWLRWPEFGFGLKPVKDRDGVYRVLRFRGDRLQATWPTVISRGTQFPFTATFPTGTFQTTKDETPPTGATPDRSDDEPF